MAFVNQQDVIDEVENCFHDLNQKFAKNREIQKYLNDDKFKVLNWDDAMTQYGSDKPDIRFDMKLVDLSEVKSDCGFGIFERVDRLFALRSDKKHGELSRKDIDELTKLAQAHGAGGLAWLRIGEDS